jgi:multidrug efflux pump subunit AcrA (membrane-fusion protein)
MDDVSAAGVKHPGARCQAPEGVGKWPPRGGSRIVPPMNQSQPAPEESGFPGGAYRANLYVYDPHGRIDWYAIAPQSFAEGRYFTMGRSPDCNIVLADGSVSAHHAYIASNGGELFLRDLGSTNGVLVNDERMSEVALRHGDVLRMGATDIRFLFSYREGPVQLVLEFVEGPNAGRSLATYGSSTTIGRLNCAVNLHGPGLAPQHVRIDAYGPELMYVVNLRRENLTRLNDGLVEGISTARDGDVLTIGEHVLRLRVVDASDVAATDEVPQGLGTLQIATDSGVRAQAPVAQILMSADDLQRLDAAHFARTGEDPTSLEMFPPSEAALLGPVPTPAVSPPPAPPPPAVSRPVRERPAADPAGRSGRHPPIAGRAPGPIPAQPRRRALWPWFVAIPLLMVAGALFALKLTPIRRNATLVGEILPSQEQPLASPARARVEKLLVAVGDRVSARDALLTLVDLDVEAEVAGLAAQIAALQHPPAPTVRAVGRAEGRIDAGQLAALSRAEVALATARGALDDANAAYNRREATFDSVTVAQRAVDEAAAAVDRQRAALTREVRRRDPGAGPSVDVERLARLMAQREAAEKKLFVTLEAPRAGLVLTFGMPDLRVGSTLRKDQPVLVLGDVSRVTARLGVPPESLAEVEAARQAIVTPEGFKEPRIPVTFERAGPAARADGTFPLDTLLENPNGLFRPGQRVRAEVELPRTDALSFLFGTR